jgi:hypothetical protein
MQLLLYTSLNKLIFNLLHNSRLVNIGIGLPKKRKINKCNEVWLWDNSEKKKKKTKLFINLTKFIKKKKKKKKKPNIT